MANKQSFAVINASALTKSIEQYLRGVIQKEQFLVAVRDFAVRRIVAETRKGRDLTKNGAAQKPLSDGYKRIRGKILSGQYGVDPFEDATFFRVDVSNLTMTGQLLDSIRGLLNAQSSKISIKATGSRSPTRIFNLKTGRQIVFKNQTQEPATNQELVEKLQKDGRTFLGLDQKGRDRIVRVVSDQLRRELKRSRFVAKR
jgi:hypothetical protein